MVIFEIKIFIVDDVRVCLICYEKFKILRYFLCKYLFCYVCLFLYIISQCKFKEVCLGFYCLVCCFYIFSFGDLEKLEDWVGFYLINDVLLKLVVGLDEIYCEFCLRDNEREKIFDYCLLCNEYLCMLCVKYYRKNMVF